MHRLRQVRRGLSDVAAQRRERRRRPTRRRRRYPEPPPLRRADRGRHVVRGACSGSALCRDVCPEGLDAYDLMRIAKVRQNVLAGKKPPASDYHLVDLSRRAQLGPIEPRWYTRRPPADARAEYVFYMGCNIMRTPHIALGVMAILDLLGLDYATVGGGANCCGIKQFRVGLPAAETVAQNTLTNFGSLQPKEVVSWCPTCEVHFNDFGASYLDREFPINHLSRLLVRHLDELRPLLQPLPMRVVVEVHAQLYEDDTVQQDIATLLSAIPGLEAGPDRAARLRLPVLHDRPAGGAAGRAGWRDLRGAAAGG